MFHNIYIIVLSKVGPDGIITTFAGTGEEGFSGDNGPAIEAQLFFPEDVIFDPDGNLYIADRANRRIRKVDTEGIITTIAGNGVYGLGGDGGPAVDAQLYNPCGLKIGPDGCLYIADSENHCIRKINKDGIITTIAGIGTSGFNGDNGPATEAQLRYPIDIALGSDGSLYIIDRNCRVRKVGTDGIITTVAGTGQYGFSGDGGPAIDAKINNPYCIEVGSNGSIYFTDYSNRRVRKVSPDGIITTIAGNGQSGYSGDGGPATDAKLSFPTGIDVGYDGYIYFSDCSNRVVRSVTPDGIIITIAGDGRYGFSGDGGPAMNASLKSTYGVAVGPDGSVYIADPSNNRVRKVSYINPGISSSKFSIASEDGSETYIFSPEGRHLKTLDALTSVVKYEFSYNQEGLLVEVTDMDGLKTTIERDQNGNPTAIVSPFGQQTSFTLDDNEYITAITNPAEETVSFSYTEDGLMTGMLDAMQHFHQFTYDSLGRLIKDEDPAGGYTILEKRDLDNGWEISTTSAEGRTKTYRVERLPDGSRHKDQYI